MAPAYSSVNHSVFNFASTIVSVLRSSEHERRVTKTSRPHQLTGLPHVQADRFPAMGASESKLVFKQGIFKLQEAKPIAADDTYWTGVC